MLPFVGLAKGATLADVGAAAAALQRSDLSPSERADLLAALYLLSGYHFTSEELLAIMSEEALMESQTYLATLSKGREGGREEGRRALLLELLSARLGPLDLLQRVTTCDAAVVDHLAQLVATSHSDEALMAEVERLLGPKT